MTLYLGCDLKPSGNAAYPLLRCQCGEAKPGRGGIPSVHVIPRCQTTGAHKTGSQPGQMDAYPLVIRLHVDAKPGSLVICPLPPQ
jgi:hypothetical protein